MTSPASPGPTPPAKPDPIPTAVAIIVLVGYAVTVGVMYFLIGSGETQWTRAHLLLSGVEAIAFAAAGFLFGREVHRGQAAAAEARADANQKAAEGGRALAAMVRAKTRPGGAKAAMVGAADPVARAAALQEDLNELSASADEILHP